MGGRTALVMAQPPLLFAAKPKASSARLAEGPTGSNLSSMQASLQRRARSRQSVPAALIQIRCLEGRRKIQCAPQMCKLSLILRGEGNHVANNPDHHLGAFPFWCAAQLAIQCELGILSEWRIRLSLDHRHHLDRFG
jgi:hypothetical protein